MNNEKLNLTSFNKAIISFKKILDRYYQEKGQDDAVRDACVQRFEYCYDLSRKILFKHLKNIGETNIDNNSLADNIKLGYKKGLLLHSWDEWAIHKDNRNNSSHGYDEKIVIEMIPKIKDFLAEIDYFYEKLAAYYCNHEN